MATQHSVKPSGSLRQMGQFLEDTVLRKLQDLSNAPAAAIKKYLAHFHHYLFSRDQIFLDTDGTILSWNDTFKRVQGYSEKEILGQHLRMFYMPLEREHRLPEKLIVQAATQGTAVKKGKWVRRDGSTYFGRLVLKAVRSTNTNQLLGFTEEIYPNVDEYE